LVDVGFEQRPFDFAHRILNVLLGVAALAVEPSETFIEAGGQGFE
jgi:hypothetical protein